MPWQNRALEYIDIVPELNFSSRFYSRMLKQLRIFPATLDDSGQKTEIKGGPPLEVLNRIQDPGGGRSQLLGSYGRLMFTTGEGILFGRELNTDQERWSFVWNGEIKVETTSGGQTRKIIHLRGPGEEREYEPDQAVCYRMWTPHPRRSYEAESPMRAALEIAEELIILTKSVRSTATSRLVNGLLFLPQEISPPPEEPLGNEDPQNDPWASDFVEHVSTQIEHPGTAEAQAPLISWVAGEYISMIRWIQIHDPQTDYMERDLRKEAIERLAYGLDMPPEALKGLGSTNHWAAMQILGDMWKSHGAPLAEQFCDELAAAYLQPALREMDYAGWQNTVVGYDASQVVVKADRSDDADSAAKLAMVSPKGYRLMKNIPEDYAPTEKERKELLEALGRGQQRQQQQPQNGRDPAADGPPLPGPEGDSGRRTRVVTSAAEAVGATMMALARCRELAGVRIRQKERQCPECVAPAIGQPPALVASIVGPGTLERLDLNPTNLVRGGADTLREVLIGWGYDKTQSHEISKMVESFAARTLFDERQPPLPAGLVTQLEKAKEAA